MVEVKVSEPPCHKTVDGLHNGMLPVKYFCSMKPLFMLVQFNDDNQTAYNDNVKWMSSLSFWDVTGFEIVVPGSMTCNNYLLYGSPTYHNYPFMVVKHTAITSYGSMTCNNSLLYGTLIYCNYLFYGNQTYCNSPFW